MNRKEAIHCLENKIQDEELRHIIFNYDDTDPTTFLEDRWLCLHYFENILRLTTLFVLHAFLVWEKKAYADGSLAKHDFSDKAEFGSSVIRIYNMLNKAYDPNKMNDEFVYDFIINLEMDYLLDTATTTSFVEMIGIKDFFGFSGYDGKLGKYINMLRKFHVNRRSQHADSTKAARDFFGVEDLIYIINVFKYLCNAKIEYERFPNVSLYAISIDVTNCYSNIFNTSTESITKIPLKYSLIKRGKDEIFYFEKFDFLDNTLFDSQKEKKQVLTLNYLSCIDSSTLTLVLTDKNCCFSCRQDETDDSLFYFSSPKEIEQFILDYDILNFGKGDSECLRDYILINNRYIKELAFVIADVISSETKKEICGHFNAKYNDIFKMMHFSSLYNDNLELGYAWDEIILLLLMEEGIHDFIRFVLKYEKLNTFREVFCKRYGEVRVKEIENKNQFIAMPLQNGQSQTEFSKRDTQAKSILMLAYNLFWEKNFFDNKSTYPITIDDTIFAYSQIKNSSSETFSSPIKKVQCWSNLVLRILYFITSFYKTVISYASMKKTKLLSENELIDYIQWEKDYSMNLKNLTSTILTHKLFTSENVQDICKRLEEAFNELFNLNKAFSNRSFANQYNKDLNYYDLAFDVLGRQQLFDEYRMSLLRDKILTGLNEFDSYGDLNDLDAGISELLTYLKEGDRLVQNELVISETAIYPLVGQYYSGVMSRDGYKYSWFRFNNNEGGTTNVKVVSDEEFDFGYYYYCIPNINRTIHAIKRPVKNDSKYNEVDTLWISPITIPCSVFNKQQDLVVEKLDEKDYDVAIDLIYESDKLFYTQLFGCIDNAKVIMKDLFENRNSKFSKQHYHVVKKDNQVIAIASIFTSEDNTGEGSGPAIRKAFIDHEEIKIPPQIDSAIEILDSIFDEYITDSAFILDDFCVKQEFRNQGIGKSFVLYLLNNARNIRSRNSYIVLSVNKNNIGAHEFYSGLGFIELSRTYAGKEEYIKMIHQ